MLPIVAVEAILTVIFNFLGVGNSDSDLGGGEKSQCPPPTLYETLVIVLKRVIHIKRPLLLPILLIRSTSQDSIRNNT